MAITQEQADKSREFHYTGNPDRQCGGTKSNRFRRTGRTQRWKRTPERFSIPAKFGFYESIRITNDNAADFHAAVDCPAGVR